MARRAAARRLDGRGDAPDTPEYAEALYWRATLAATSADAERIID